MDNTSFAPGDNSINNSVPPLTPQYSTPGPKHLPKLVTWIVLLLAFGSAAYAGIWYWQDRQVGEDYTTSFTPRPLADPTADWKTYTNTKYRFEFKYPAKWVLGEYKIGLNDFSLAVDPVKIVSQQTRESVDTYPGLISIHFGDCLPPDCGNIVGYENFEKVKIGEQASIEARKYEIPVYNNSPNPSYEGKHAIYHSVRYGTVQLLEIGYVSDLPDKYLSEFNQILSTFKFIDSVVGQFCGGIAGVACPSGYECKLDGSYPDAGGTCVKN